MECALCAGLALEQQYLVQMSHAGDSIMDNAQNDMVYKWDSSEQKLQ